MIKRNPVIYAAKNDHDAVASILLAHPEIDVSLWDETGTKALVYAAENDHHESMDLLLFHVPNSILGNENG